MALFGLFLLGPDASSVSCLLICILLNDGTTICIVAQCWEELIPFG